MNVRGEFLACLIRKGEQTMSYNREEAIKTAADNIMREINVCGLPVNEIAHRMANDHRTLQQGFMALCVAFIKEEANATMWDLRNEQCVKFAKEVVDKIDESTMYMPCI